jgi:hypothetical protein
MTQKRRTPFLAAVSFVAAAVLSVVPALAGEVYGKITEGSASVGDKATVGARCGSNEYAARPTDKSGSFHLIVGASGKCTLTIGYKNKSASLEFVSYDDGAQIDVVLEMKDGALQARRR